LTLNRVSFALTFVFASALVYVYASFVVLAVTRCLSPLTTVEIVVMLSQLLRVVLVFLLPGLRRAKPLAVADLLLAETFMMPVLGALSFFTGEGVYAGILSQLAYAWGASLALFAPSIIIYRFVVTMYRGSRLTVFLPLSAFVVGLLYSLEGVGLSSSVGIGPGALIESFLKLLSGSPANALMVSSPGLAAAAVAAFVAVVLYATTRSLGVQRLEVPALIVTLAGLLGAIAWVVAASYLTTNTMLFLTLPTAAMGAIFWWSTSEKAA
jgi:hypothetical protein